ncbi:hypothetical protein [Nocardia sp. CY41]|uniref:hypothetical protein n=1 Tax=Nocardia sp. CY41 TaxID=2608686 RepID=UPI002E2B847E|nr:hypothetical protein [Nocardia sp. CY41]
MLVEFDDRSQPGDARGVEVGAMPVIVGPGRMALQRMPSAACAQVMLRVMPMTPCSDAV